jgi:hypothetical protein
MPGRFRKVISLGSGCATAHHIRNQLWQREAYFFDWLVTPGAGLVSLLETDLRQLFRDPGEFEEQPAPPSPQLAMRHGRLGFISYHDLDASARMADFPKVVEKYNFLADRWERTMTEGGKILFVRHLTHPQEVAAICEALRRRYPDLDFEMLAVQEQRGAAETWNLPGVLVCNIFNTPYDKIDRGEAWRTAWQGDAEGWQLAFRAAGALAPATPLLVGALPDSEGLRP